MNIKITTDNEPKLSILADIADDILVITDTQCKLQVHFNTQTKQIVNVVYPWKEGFEPSYLEHHIYHAFDRIIAGMKHPRERQQYKDYIPAMQEKCNEQGAKLVGVNCHNNSHSVAGTIVHKGSIFTIEPHN